MRRTFLSLLLVIAVVCVAGLASADDNAPNTDFTPYGIYETTAPRPPATEPVVTTLPLELQPSDRIALIGNTLFDRARHFGYFEAYL